LTAFVSVCQTVAYAHSRGVIHRDLKPQNVALGDFGEVVVLDWGMAWCDLGMGNGEWGLKTETEATLGAEGEEFNPHSPLPITHSEIGAGRGTPGYMAPEQAEGGRGHTPDARTDVHGLGAILYEVLTGRPPYQGATTGEVLRQAREGRPPAPRSLWPG